MKTIEEMISVMQAAKEGKTIQCANAEKDDWEDLENPRWDWIRFDYRVKTEPNVRPYANAKEFVEAMHEHGPMLKNLEGYTYRIPTGVCGIVVWIDGNTDSVKYEDLLKSYEWQDGHKCGIME